MTLASAAPVASWRLLGTKCSPPCFWTFSEASTSEPCHTHSWASMIQKTFRNQRGWSWLKVPLTLTHLLEVHSKSVPQSPGGISISHDGNWLSNPCYSGLSFSTVLYSLHSYFNFLRFSFRWTVIFTMACPLPSNINEDNFPTGQSDGGDSSGCFSWQLKPIMRGWLRHQPKTVLLTEEEKNQRKEEVEVLESAGFTTKKTKTERWAGL